MNLHTSLNFRDEEQRKKFDMAVAESGLKQKAVLQAMIDEFLENVKNTQRIVARAEK